jgi:hypothetical protein
MALKNASGLPKETGWDTSRQLTGERRLRGEESVEQRQADSRYFVTRRWFRPWITIGRDPSPDVVHVKTAAYRVCVNDSKGKPQVCGSLCSCHTTYIDGLRTLCGLGG